jgi:hypothetical protein
MNNKTIKKNKKPDLGHVLVKLRMCTNFNRCLSSTEAFGKSLLVIKYKMDLCRRILLENSADSCCSRIPELIWT